MQLRDLGIIPYEEALELQQNSAEARKRGEGEDVLYLLQHEPVITLGRFKGETDLRVPPEQLLVEGISLIKTSRGGKATYHCPGQIVGYPVINLRESRLDIPGYTWNLEEVVIRSLSSMGLQGSRMDGYTGVWVSNKKICSIGINVDRNVTTHGFALNVNNDLSYFKYINPCGLDARIMTSVSEQLRRHVGVETVIENLTQAFSDVFHVRF
jgi:lipoate-protein ligase B